MVGWIKLQRDIMDHWIAQDCEYLSVWIRMLSEANFEARTIMFNNQVVKLERGQLIFGLDSYHKKTKVSVMRLRRLITLLESDGMINRVINAKYSIISIVNYDKHQSGDTLATGSEQGQNKQGTSTEQAGNNTKRSKELKEAEELKKNNSQFDFSGWPYLPSNQVFNDWVKLRKAKKAPITQTVINQVGKELNKAVDNGWTVDDIFAETISSGWSKVCFAWVDRESGKTKSSGFDTNKARSKIGAFLDD